MVVRLRWWCVKRTTIEAVGVRDMLGEREPHHKSGRRDGDGVVPADLLLIIGQLVARRRASPNPHEAAHEEN